MANLDNLESIKRLDQEDMLGSIQDFPDQIQNCWKDWQTIAVPTHFINAKNVLILGIGGSGHAGFITSLLAYHQANIPVFVLPDYDIPAWVDKNTLVIAVSYSGETEETVNALEQSLKKTEKIITISIGGSLYSIGSRNKALHYRIHYGCQPRAALGYGLISVMAIFKKMNLIEFSDDDIKEAILLVRAMQKKIDVNSPMERNMAKKYAHVLHGKIPIILGSGVFGGVAKRWKASINENSKTTSYFEFIPEMNHMSLAGLEFPEGLKQKVFFLILQSNFDHERNKLRQEITAQIIGQRNIGCEIISLSPQGSLLAELMQMIHLGDYISYYLGILNDVEPNPIKIISFLKDKLGEQPFNKE